MIPKQKNRILFVTNDLEIGGVQRLLIDLIKNMDREKYDPIVVLVCGAGPLIKELKELSVPCLLFPCIRRNLMFKWLNPFQIILLSYWIRRHHIDICHTHLFLGNMIGRIAAFLARCPVIISTEHNTYLDKGKISQFIDRTLAPLCKTIVAVTGAVADFTAEQELIPRHRFSVIYNGIDIKYFDKTDTDAIQLRQQLNIPEDHIIIGSVGRLVPQKDYRLLLQSFYHFYKKHPKSKLVIVGDGNQMETLQKYTQELSISEKVYFAGFQKDIRPFLAMFDIFITTPRYEGLGLVILEAMTTGVPVVAASVGGIPEIVQREKTGLLVDGRNPEHFSNAILRIMENKDFRDVLVTQAKQRVEEHFSIERMVCNYQNLYERLLLSNRE